MRTTTATQPISETVTPESVGNDPRFRRSSMAYLSPRDIAAALAVDWNCITKWCRDGYRSAAGRIELRHERLGKQYRIRWAWVEDFMAACKAGDASGSRVGSCEAGGAVSDSDQTDEHDEHELTKRESEAWKVLEREHGLSRPGTTKTTKRAKGKVVRNGRAK